MVMECPLSMDQILASPLDSGHLSDVQGFVNDFSHLCPPEVHKLNSLTIIVDFLMLTLH